MRELRSGRLAYCASRGERFRPTCVHKQLTCQGCGGFGAIQAYALAKLFTCMPNKCSADLMSMPVSQPGAAA
jgi:hypothetical protein